MYNYHEDYFGKVCLEEASKCKAPVGFGAVVVRKGKILGKGRNRRATDKDRKRLSHVDYAIHAEQSAILDTIDNGYSLRNCQLFVVGIALQGKNKGKLTTREEPTFICSKCPHALVKYNLPVNVPYIRGWYLLSPERAMEVGKETANKGAWKSFVVTGKVD